MRRKGNTIFFNMCDSRLVDDLPEELDASEAPALYESIAQRQASLGARLCALKQKGVGMAEQTVAQEEANMESTRLEAFLGGLGKVAAIEIAEAMADKLSDAVYGPPA